MVDWGVSFGDPTFALAANGLTLIARLTRPDRGLRRDGVSSLARDPRSFDARSIGLIGALPSGTSAIVRKDFGDDGGVLFFHGIRHSGSDVDRCRPSTGAVCAVFSAMSLYCCRR